MIIINNNHIIRIKLMMLELKELKLKNERIKKLLA